MATNMFHDNGGQAGDFESPSLQILLKYITAMYKKEYVQRPELFNYEKDMEYHIKQVQDYCKGISVKDDDSKCCILRETLPTEVRNQLIFENEYKNNISNFQWHIEKLKFIFPSSKNKISDVINLFNLKQNSRDIATFVQEIKNAIVMSTQIYERDRKIVALKVFLSGLDDENLAKAVKIREPKNIDDAMKIAASVKQLNHNEKVNVINNKNIKENFNGTLLELEKQISNLTQLVMAMMEKINNIQRQHNPRTFQNQRNTNYNQNNNMRNRTSFKNYQTFRPTRRCFKCGENGHIQKFCRSTQIREINTSDEVERQEKDSFYDGTEDQDDQLINFISRSCYFPYQNNYEKAIKIQKDHKKMSGQFKKSQNVPYKENLKRSSIYGNYDSSIHEIYDFVCGKDLPVNNSTTNIKTMTVVPTSKSRPRTHHKPMVKCRVNNRVCEVLIDSGADVNVIEQSFLERKLGINKTRKSSSVLKCANNSQLDVCGEIILSVQIGPEYKQLPFVIVKNIVPSIILGIRSLKSLKIDIIVTNDSVKCQGVTIPFTNPIPSEKPKCIEKLSKNYVVTQF
jgi:hypothetical protein